MTAKIKDEKKDPMKPTKASGKIKKSVPTKLGKGRKMVVTKGKATSNPSSAAKIAKTLKMKPVKTAQTKSLKLKSVSSMKNVPVKAVGKLGKPAKAKLTKKCPEVRSKNSKIASKTTLKGFSKGTIKRKTSDKARNPKGKPGLKASDGKDKSKSQDKSKDKNKDKIKNKIKNKIKGKGKDKGKGKEKSKDKSKDKNKDKIKDKIKGKGKKAKTVRESKIKKTKKKKVQGQTLSPEEKEQRAKEKAERLAARDRIYVKGWEGNSDDEGSVDTGALEEDLCFWCGLVTSEDPEWDSLVICDRCNGDFHLRCVGLDKVPRAAWVCPRCKEDEEEFWGLKYMLYKPDEYGTSAMYKNSRKPPKVEIPEFVLPRPSRARSPIEQVYSPSRPLEAAWGELLEKGFMCVSRVFPHDILRRLTHGTVERHTLSGRTGTIWKGALREIETKINGGTCHNMIDRDGRYDLRLPDFVIDELGLNSLLAPILAKLRSVMGNPEPKVRTQNVVFVPVGSPAQDWHADDSMHDTKKYRYFTIIIHLNLIDENCGGTEIWSKKAQRGDMIRNRPGDAFVFHGSLHHRGQANSGFTHRLFYYASFACRHDTNIGF